MGDTMGKKVSKMYQVVVRYIMDDIPVLLTSSRSKAFREAENLDLMADSLHSALDVIDVEVGEPLGVDVFTFRNGRITSANIVQEF
jgi:hypothetical protein